jgi:hypothetical protein
MPWVTLDSGQHVYIGKGGEFMPKGPGSRGIGSGGKQVEFITPTGKGTYRVSVKDIEGQSHPVGEYTSKADARAAAVAVSRGQRPASKEQMAIFRAAQDNTGLSLAVANVANVTGQPKEQIAKGVNADIRAAVQRHKSGQLTLSALRRDQRIDRDIAVQQKKFWMDAMLGGKWGVSGESASRELAFAGLRIRARAQTIALLTHK